MIKNNQIILSQSVTKELGVFIIDEQMETASFCPKRYYHKFIAKDYVYEEPTGAPAPMECGLYGETLVIGGSSKGREYDTLRLKKNGSKYIDHERVDIMAQRMYGYLVGHGVRWGASNTQVPLIAKYGTGIWLSGEFDIFPTEYDSRLSIIDTKFTKDTTGYFSSMSDKNIRHSTISCWGDFNNLQKNQPLFYHFIARNFKDVGLEAMIRFREDKEELYKRLFSLEYDYSDIDFKFVVAGYGVKDLEGQLKTFSYEWTKRRAGLLDYLVHESIRRIKDAVDSEFEARPKEPLCKKCPFKDTCLKSK